MRRNFSDAGRVNRMCSMNNIRTLIQSARGFLNLFKSRFISLFIVKRLADLQLIPKNKVVTPE
ncbi:transposase [Paraburkholderia sacchari]